MLEILFQKTSIAKEAVNEASISSFLLLEVKFS